MCIDLKLADITVLSLIDTGAARSMMREDVWRQVCSRRGQPAMTFPGLRLRALSGHEIVTLGKAIVFISGTRCEFYIVKKLQHDALLGDDVLTQLGASITFNDRLVKLADIPYPAVQTVQGLSSMDGVYADIDYWKGAYPDVFPNTEDPIGHTTSVIMSIDTGNAYPVNQRPYRLPLAKRKFVDDELDRMLRMGVIEPSTSPWASPITLAHKKGPGGGHGVYARTTGR